MACVAVRTCGRVQLPYGGGVRVRIGPERVRPLPVAVRVLQPRRAALDGPVHEELDPVDPPVPPAPALRGDQPGQVVGVRPRHAPGREPQPHRQHGLPGHRPDQLGVPGVHDVRAGEPGRRHRGQQLHEPRPPDVVRRPGHDLGHQIHRRMLDEVPGGPPGKVADHLRALRERARSGHPRGGQRRAAHQGRVSVVQPEEGGRAAEHVLDEGPVDGPPLEGVVVEAVADDPAVDPLGGPERGPEARQVGDPGEVHPRRHVQPPHRVTVRVHQAGHEVRALQPYDLCSRPAPVPYVALVAHRRDQPVAYGDGGGVGTAGVESTDLGAERG